MGAQYTSPKPDGYMAIRNEIYRHREVVQEQRTRAAAAEAKVPPPMNHENYGFGKIKY